MLHEYSQNFHQINCHHSSVDSSASTILWSGGLSPKHIIYIFIIYSQKCAVPVFALWRGRKINKKRPGLAHKKLALVLIPLLIYHLQSCTNINAAVFYGKINSGTKCFAALVPVFKDTTLKKLNYGASKSRRRIIIIITGLSLKLEEQGWVWVDDASVTSKEKRGLILDRDLRWQSS